MLKENKDKLNKSKKRVRDIETAQKIAQETAATLQNHAHEKIAQVVSYCLEAVFDDPYSFKIRFERKRGKTDAVLSFDRNGLVIDPISASGGGVVDVASFALRLSCLLLTKPAIRKTLVLDEPFRFVSEEYQDRVAEMLKRISEDMHVQIIMVTHNTKYQVGKTIRL